MTIMSHDSINVPPDVTGTVRQGNGHKVADAAWLAGTSDAHPEGGHADDDAGPRRERAAALRGRLLDSQALAHLPAPEPLIDGMLYLDSLAWLIGKPGHGKSFVAIDMAGSVATGRPWQDHSVRQGTVLYVIAEGARGAGQRVAAWEAAAGVRMDGVFFLPVPVQAGHPQDWQALIDVAGELSASLVVLDTQARCTVGKDENSAQDMGIVVDALERLRAATGACVLAIHHTGRTGEHSRGSNSIDGAASTIIKSTKAGDQITLTTRLEDGGKQKDAPALEDVPLRLVAHSPSAILVQMALTRSAENEIIWGGCESLKSPGVRDLLERWRECAESDPVRVSTLVKGEVCSEPTFHRYKNALIREGLIEATGEGRSRRYVLRWRPET